LGTRPPPAVLQAWHFTARDPQSGLKACTIAGNPAYQVDPYKDDFYRRLIELRQEVKSKMKEANAAGDVELVDRLDAEQQAMKITANSTSYGIFVEMNVTDYESTRKLTCFGNKGSGFDIETKNVEEPGNYFHPLLGTLITGAARLMLAITEKLVGENGLEWAMCDTDSLAFACPDNMHSEDFLSQIERIRR